MRKLIHSFVLILLLLLAGCGAEKIRDDFNPANHSLVFGYIDTEDSMGTMYWLQARQVLPKTENPLIDINIQDGMFYLNSFKLGSYQLEAFGNAKFILYFPRQDADKARFKIEKSGLYYLGSYKINRTKDGIFSASKFDIQTTTKPTEKELLERILKLTESKPWEDRIRKRLQELAK